MESAPFWLDWRGRLRAQHLTSAGRCGAEGRFLKKAPQKLFCGGQLDGASFFEEKPRLLLKSDRNTGKRKLAFFCPYFSRTGGEAKASPPKMTQHSAVPPRKVFAELFSKSDPPRPQAPLVQSTKKIVAIPITVIATIFFSSNIVPTNVLEGLTANREGVSTIA